MSSPPALSSLFLKPLRPDRYGHAWVYDNEIARGPEPPVEDGAFVHVIDHNKKPVGIAYYNGHSKLPARLIAASPDEFKKGEAAFWKARLSRALEYRKARYPMGLPPCYRLVYGEADGLPGLVVDAYGDYLVVQFLTLGMDIRRDLLIDALHGLVFPKGIYERSDSPARKLEGLEERTGLLRGEEPPTPLEISQDGAVMLIDILHGAKTGLFLDQIENQKAASREASGRDVLNCFSYTGLFGLRCALAGAKSVTDVEISGAFQETNKLQWARNARAICPHTCVTDNAFDYLRLLEGKDYKTDMVILDPPAFTKTRAQRDGAVRGYNDINRRAMHLLRPGGILVTCSCSHHVSLDEFRQIVRLAARDAGRSLRLIEQRGQPPDHPVLLSVPESEYLKCLILEVQ